MRRSKPDGLRKKKDESSDDDGIRNTAQPPHAAVGAGEVVSAAADAEAFD